MNKDIDNFIKNLPSDYYECIIDYIKIPNEADIAPLIHYLINKYGTLKVKYISENIELLRIKHKTTYDNIQDYIRNNYVI